MRILFDHQIFINQKFGGISLYISRLIEGINQRKGHSAELTLPFFSNENLPKQGADKNKLRQLAWDLMPSKGQRVSNLFSLQALNSKRYDLLHPTYYDSYFLRGIARKRPWTVTYHDMVHELLSTQFPNMHSDPQIIRNKERFAKEASMLIAISEHTKKDMVNYYQIDPANIKVVHHGNPYEESKTHDDSSTSVYPFPYLLFVGHRWVYKNFDRFLIAVANLLRRYDIHLICAGGPSFTLEETILITQHGVKNLVHHQIIKNDTLPKLYRHAHAFVFPSLLEGFGFPVLEAFTCHCPCILSNNSCFPEIAGKEAAMYFDPSQTESISIAVEKAITTSETQRNNLIKNGIKQLENFSWKKTTQETLSIYKEIIERA